MTSCDSVTMGLTVIAATTASCAVTLWFIYGILHRLWTLARLRDAERSRHDPWI